MKIGDKMKTPLIVLGALVVIAILFFADRSEPLVPEANWRLQFHITDKSGMAIAGTHVRVSAIGKITAFNKVFSVEPKRWHVDGIADANGDYLLDMRACTLDVTFSKDGYVDAEKDFHGGDSTADASVNITIGHK